MKTTWKWKITITLLTKTEIEIETEAESIKKAIESLSYTAKKLNGEITCVQRLEMLKSSMEIK